MRIEIFRHQKERPWSYAKLDLYQREIARQILEEGRDGVALLSEVAPVVSLGKRSVSEDLIYPREDYVKRGMAFFESDRGGRATYHGTGQWLLFLVEKIEKLTGDVRGVRKSVNGMLEMCVITADKFGVKSEVLDGEHVGVWTQKGKIAAAGLEIYNRILLHGICINGYETENSFWGIKPCGSEPRIDYILPADLAAPIREERFMKLGEELLAAASKTLMCDFNLSPKEAMVSKECLISV